MHHRVATVEGAAQLAAPTGVHDLELETTVVEAALEIRQRAHRKIVDADHL